MQFTIESRGLTRDVQAQRTCVEATDADEAITRYVRLSKGELMSCTRPVPGRESIVTMKKEDAVFLVRVYSD